MVYKRAFSKTGQRRCPSDRHWSWQARRFHTS